MSKESRQILEMLAEKKITVDEAERLLRALEESSEGERESSSASQDKQEEMPKKPRYLYVSVKPKKESGKTERVNIKVPLGLLRTGLKFGSVLPDSAKEKIIGALGQKGLRIEKLDEEAFREIVENLSKLSISVDDENEKVDIYCE